jgi:hypothetical protein
MNGQIIFVGYFLLLIVCAAAGAILGIAYGASRANPRRFLLGGILLGVILLFPLALAVLGF